MLFLHLVQPNDAVRNCRSVGVKFGRFQVRDHFCFWWILKKLAHFVDVDSVSYGNILILEMGKTISQIKYLFHLHSQRIDTVLVSAFCESGDNGELCMK